MIDHPPFDVSALPTTGFAFPGPLRDELNAAILASAKTSTTSLVLEYGIDDEPFPEVGRRLALLDSDEAPIAVIETTRVLRARLGDVDLQHAIDEGEGYETLDQWRAAHERFWHGAQYRAFLNDPDFTVNDDTEAVLERFRLVADLRDGTGPTPAA